MLKLKRAQLQRWYGKYKKKLYVYALNTKPSDVCSGKLNSALSLFARCIGDMCPSLRYPMFAIIGI